MIVMDLCCGQLHRFEGWFASGEEYSRQLDQALLSCPVCGDREISRLPSGPHLRRSESRPPPSEAVVPSEPRRAFASLHEVALSVMEHLISTSEDVGERFADEARRIHRDEAPRRNIRGVATREEARDLADEGIAVVALALPAKSEMH